MNNLVQIKQKLEKADAKYTLHPVPAGTGTSVAEHIEAFGLEFSDGCATIVFSTDKGFIALMRRDDCRIDNRRFKKLLGIKSLRFANPEELRRETGCEPGMVSPFTVDMPMYIDKKVLEKQTVRVGSGGNEFSLEIRVDDLVSITKAETIDICDVDPRKAGKAEKRILSGITPSSSKGLHLGNFLGAVKPHIEFQDQGECFYFIADYHALNTVYDAEVFRSNTYETYLDYLALGIDLDKTVFYLESQVPDIFELTEILNNVVTYAQMQKMHAFKDKLANPDADIGTINMGLFNYPILMAADILAFEPDIVPVGEDQAQHVEIARDIAKAFNNRYGDVIKVPELFIKKDVARVPGTDGERKMSKSLGNDLTLFADEQELKKQIMGITTDPNRIKKDDPGDPEKNVIFQYMKLMKYDEIRISELENRYKEGSVGDVEVKMEFYGFFLEYFAESRERRVEIGNDRERISKIIAENSSQARNVADKTMEKVRRAIGSLA